MLVFDDGGWGGNWKIVINRIILSVLMEKLNLQMKAEWKEMKEANV